MAGCRSFFIECLFCRVCNYQFENLNGCHLQLISKLTLNGKFPRGKTKSDVIGSEEEAVYST